MGERAKPTTLRGHVNIRKRFTLVDGACQRNDNVSPARRRKRIAENGFVLTLLGRLRILRHPNACIRAANGRQQAQAKPWPARCAHFLIYFAWRLWRGMFIIYRYLLRQFLQIFAICFCSMYGLYIVIDAFTNLEEFLRLAKSTADCSSSWGNTTLIAAFRFSTGPAASSP